MSRTAVNVLGTVAPRPSSANQREKPDTIHPSDPNLHSLAKLMKFKLVSDYKPQGDQPEAIDSLVRSLEEDNQDQTLLGVTGSGKTFTMANVIERLQRPALVISHNKTLAAQLYSEFKAFFRRMPSNTSSVITTTTNRKPTYLQPTPSSRRTLRSMKKSNDSDSPQPVR